MQGTSKPKLGELCYLLNDSPKRPVFLRASADLVGDGWAWVWIWVCILFQGSPFLVGFEEQTKGNPRCWGFLIKDRPIWTCASNVKLAYALKADLDMARGGQSKGQPFSAQGDDIKAQLIGEIIATLHRFLFAISFTHFLRRVSLGLVSHISILKSTPHPTTPHPTSTSPPHHPDPIRRQGLHGASLRRGPAGCDDGNL